MDPDEFFTGRELSRRLFETVRAAVEEAGPAEMRISKSQIAFRRRRGFAWVWLPAMYLRRSNTAPLVLSLALPCHDPSPRWKQIVEPARGRCMHHLELHSVNDLDQEVKDWLQSAWSAA